MRNAVADSIEIFRRRSPNMIRKLLPRWFKDALIDLEWNLYRSKNRHLKEEIALLRSPILIISIPKSGTHLLKSLLLTLPGTSLKGYIASSLDGKSDKEAQFDLGREKLSRARPGQIYSWHVPYNCQLASWLSARGVHCLFLYRDPRDYTVSFTRFMMNPPSHLSPSPYAKWLRALETDEERLLHVIRGFALGHERTGASLSPTNLPNANLMYRQFLGWRNDPNTFTIRFEDLITARCNGQQDRFSKVISQMLKFLCVLNNDLSGCSLSELIETGTDPKKSTTFRTGKSGVWQTEYKQEHVQAFKKIAGDLLIELGYERDTSWTVT